MKCKIKCKDISAEGNNCCLLNKLPEGCPLKSYEALTRAFKNMDNFLEDAMKIIKKITTAKSKKEIAEVKLEAMILRWDHEEVTKKGKKERK